MTSPIRYLLDPALWCREVLGVTPWQKQIEILESVRDNKVTAVKSCHAAGKSFVAASATLWFLYNHPRSVVITTAPTDRQVSGILWKEIRAAHQRAKVPLRGECLTQELRLDTDWWAIGFTAPEYTADKFQGFHAEYILVIADEASGISEDIFEAIDGVLTSDQSRLLMIGNPTNPAGRFHKEFAGTDAARITIDAFNTPNFTRYGITEQDILSGTWQEKITGPLPAPYLVTPGWVSDRAKRWGIESPLYKARVLAEFPVSSADTLISLHLIEAAVERTLPEGDPVVLGADIARFGGDETVILSRQGSRARVHKVLPQSDTMATSGEIIKAMRETGALVAKIDAVGIGAGVFDRLNEQGIPVEEMQSGAAAQDRERFANARAEWWWSLRTRFEAADIDIPDDETLISQLSGIRYKINSRGQILIESKDDMKRRGVSSPDRADALMLAFSEFDQSLNARFSPRTIDQCVRSEPPVVHGIHEYVCAVTSNRQRNTFCFAVGHSEQGNIIVDNVTYLTPDGTGQQYWISVFKEVMQARWNNGVEVFLVDNHTKMGIGFLADSYDFFSLMEIPATTEDREKIYTGLAILLQQNHIRLVRNDRLLREIRIWFTTHHAGRQVVGDVGVEAVAVLADRLSSYLASESFFGNDRPGSREWPDDKGSHRQEITFIAGGAWR